MSTGRVVRDSVVIGLVLPLTVLVSPLAAQPTSSKLWQVALPNGKHIHVMVERPAEGRIRAAIVLLPGGDGRLKLDPTGKINRLRNNFLVRSRQDLHLAGLVTALVDAPSDRQSKPGLLAGYRASKIHAARDIGTVVAKLKTTFKVPVFLVGNSRGAVSAANAARRSGQTIKGLALTASVTVPNRKGATLRSAMLDKVRLPTLFVHHASDRCAVSPLHGARKSFEVMQDAGASVRWTTVTGGRTGIVPCTGQSHHGFWGAEGQAIGHLIKWIEKLLDAPEE